MSFHGIRFSILLMVVAGLGAFRVWAAEDAKGSAAIDDAAQPVAKIGDKEVITRGEFEHAVSAAEQVRMAMMRQQGVKDFSGVELSHEQRLRVLDTLVDSRIEIMMAKESGATVGDDVVKAQVEKLKTGLPKGVDYDTFLKQRGVTEKEVFDRTKERLEVKQFEEDQTKGITVSDDEVKGQFEKLKERGFTDVFDVQHILIKAREDDAAAMAEAKKKIDAIYERLKKGEDFSTVAKAVSEDENSKENGGMYKDVHRGQMVPSFDKHMAGTKVGEISEPFSSPYGWHVLKVVRKGTDELTPELAEKIKKQMIGAKQKMAIRKMVEDKRSTLNITISLPAELPGAAAPSTAPEKARQLDGLINAAS